MERKTKKIVLCGIMIQGIEIIEHLREQDIEVTHIVTIKEELAKKNNAVGWVSYEELAEKYSIPVHYLETYGMKNEKDLEFFKEEGFDLMLLGGWQRLVPDEVLSTLTFGGIGQHGSSELLPKGRGRSPLNWSLIQNKKQLIWHLFYLTPGIDDGEIIDIEYFDINSWDDITTLYYKVSVAVRHMLSRSIPKILNNDLTSRPQLGSPTYYEKRTPDDGEIDWTLSVNEIYNLVRAVTNPYPGAFTFSADKKIMIWKAQPWDTRVSFFENAESGEVVEIFSSGDYVVKCKDGLLLVTESDDEPFRGKIYARKTK